MSDPKTIFTKRECCVKRHSYGPKSLHYREPDTVILKIRVAVNQLRTGCESEPEDGEFISII